jgi:ABC-2 type transport system ATP-binding protein
MTTAILAKGLEKSYGANHAVRGVDLSVEQGEIVAVVGPNGAGKTSVVEILEGYRKRDAGEATVLGVDPETGGRDLRRKIGIVLQSAGIDPFLTVREILRLYAGYYPRPRDVEEVIALVGLDEKAGSRVKTLSGGQQRRVDLALGLVGDPELLFLDEPTTGFDPGARRSAWTIVANLRTLGKTVLLTTHYMDEAQQLADRVVVVAGGKVVAEGSPDEIGGRSAAQAVVRFVLPPGTSLADLPVQGAEPDGDGVLVRTMHPTAVVHVLSGWALDRGRELIGLTITRPTLEDVYMALVADQPAPGPPS